MIIIRYNDKMINNIIILLGNWQFYVKFRRINLGTTFAYIISEQINDNFLALIIGLPEEKDMKRPLHLAIVGFPGAVSQEMLSILENSELEINQLTLVGIPENAGKKAKFRGHDYFVIEVSREAFHGVDIALFAAGGDASKELAPIASATGAIVVDNSSAWRMDPNVPLVVPEVNPQDLDHHQGIIANPNCSTIQLVMALHPIHENYQVKRVVVSTYQSVSGAGAAGPCELTEQVMTYAKHQEIEPVVFQHQILFNLIPQIDVFLEDGYTKEELKMMDETKKILGSTIDVAATCVRVPVFRSHSESVNIETVKPFELSDIKRLLAASPGVVVQDNPEKFDYPMPLQVKGHNDVFVGRIRRDTSVPNGLNLWLVADNVRKGAALNAVQIAETLVKRGLIK